MIMFSIAKGNNLISAWASDLWSLSNSGVNENDTSGKTLQNPRK